MKANKRNLLLLAAILLVILAGGGYYAWTAQPASPESTKTTYKTAKVKRGDIALTVSGAGTLVAGNQMTLGFGTSGTVAQVNVQEGDMIKAGDVLASLEGEDSLTLDVSAKTIAVQTGEHDLEVLLGSGGKNAAQALIDLAKAQETYENAKDNLHYKGQDRCRISKTQSYYMDYLYANRRVNEWESYLSDGSGYGTDYIYSKLIPMRNERDLAYINWKYCEGYTDSEILASEVNLSVAELNLKAAQEEYQAQKANAGLDTDEITRQELTLKNSRLALAAAKSELEGVQIISPMNGVVLSVNGAAGERASTGVFMTIADPDRPFINAYLDEEDMTNLKVGNSASVVFDAAPNKTFTGTVTEINPSLVKYNSYSMIQAVIEMQDPIKIRDVYMPWGLTAAVDIKSSESKNTLLVLTETLKEKTDGTFMVYLLNGQGQAEAHDVEVGIQSGIYSEIINGLTEGETVITGTVEELK
jgi:multidrug efflux pump subunit AcrA (membrane-fusion protein)